MGGVGGSLDFLAALRLFKEGMRSVSPVDVGPPEGFESWILGVEVGDKHTSSIFCGRFVTLQLPVNNCNHVIILLAAGLQTRIGKPNTNKLLDLVPKYADICLA
jgi:hypothetical protein